MYKKLALAILIASSSLNVANAEKGDDLTSQLIKVSRQFQQENAEGKEKLKATLTELSNLTDQYLVSVAESGKSPSAPLVDASHQVKQLLHS